jgi:hypothetical protein
MSITNILPLLTAVKQTGKNRWTACCPVHNDKTPSLVITEKDNGKILMHCFGCGCGIDEICQALGISTDEVFPERLDPHYAGQPKREYFNPGDVLKSLVKEITIAQLCLADLNNGLVLTKANLDRLDQAIEKISQGKHYAGL